MNNRKAKHIRRLAEQAMLEWYKSLLPEEDAERLTMRMVKEYVPKEDYYTETVKVQHGKFTFEQKIIHISENTQRWFYKQEKRKWTKI